MSDFQSAADPGRVRPLPAVGRSLRWMLLSMLLAVMATVALSAWAQPGPGGPGMGSPGAGAGHLSARHVDRMLDGIGATEAQRMQIKQIMQAAAADLKPQHEAGRALRERAAQIFAAPDIDAAAAESVRQQMQQQHDQVSRRMLQAMLEAGKVLSPEQRAKLGERMKQRGEKMRDRMQRMQRDEPRR